MRLTTENPAPGAEKRQVPTTEATAGACAAQAKSFATRSKGVYKVRTSHLHTEKVVAGASTASLRSRSSSLVCRKRRPGAGIHLKRRDESARWTRAPRPLCWPAECTARETPSGGAGIHHASDLLDTLSGLDFAPRMNSRRLQHFEVFLTCRPIAQLPITRLSPLKQVSPSIMKSVRTVSAVAALLAASVPSPTAKADPIDDYIQAQMARNHIPGVAVAVVRAGRIEKLAGYGIANLEWNAPVGPDTAFQLASATKPLTGTALMLLVQEGKLDLDAPVTRYLDDVPESWSAITIRHLASHSAGIKDDLGPIATTLEGYEAMKRLPPEFAPGERSTYGISGYIALMVLIERVGGEPFATFMSSRLFQPLGIVSTCFDNATDRDGIRVADLIPNRASVYEWGAGRQRVFQFLFGAHAYSAGGLYSTTADLARWIVALDTEMLLSLASQEDMWTPQRLLNGESASFSMGWVVGSYRGQRTVGRSGGPALADILRFPDARLTVIVLANQQRLYPWLAQGIADRLITFKTTEAEGIEDRDPETTRHLENVLQAAATGKADAAWFTPEAQERFLPAINNFLPLFFNGLEPVKSFVPIERKIEGDEVMLVYRAVYGTKPIRWTFNLTHPGKLKGFEARPE